VIAAAVVSAQPGVFDFTAFATMLIGLCWIIAAIQLHVALGVAATTRSAASAPRQGKAVGVWLASNSRAPLHRQ